MARKTSKRTASPKTTSRKKKPNAVETALAAFAHDVRTPLTGILATSDLLVTAGLSDRERQWAQTIKASAEHLAELTTLLVDAAKQRHGRLALRSDAFDPDVLARRVGQSLASRAAAKGIAAKVSLAPDLPFVMGDAVRLHAALENLVDNAVKFTERGQVALRVTAAPARGGKVKLRFVVTDTGIGLTAAEIRRLFRPFSQASVAVASRFGGAGLGLSSVRELARAMGGDVNASSRKKGAEFNLHVVLSRAPAAEKRVAAIGAKPAKPLDVLCIEDNPYGRVVVNTVLTELGHRTEFAVRGEDAVTLLARRSFDVALVDMVLPGIDGVETIRRLRAKRKDLHIVGLSGRGEDEAAARKAGADDFLQKPVSSRALARALVR
jgi:two-component system, sensor histidine kinase